MRIWIDTDPALGYSENGHPRDVDDAFLIVEAIRDPDIEVVGITSVSGNSPAKVGFEVASDLVSRTGLNISVVEGASLPGSETDGFVCDAAVEAMAEALFTKEGGGRWDVLTFQEVWHVRERAVLVAAARKHGLRHHHYFENGCGFPFWRGQVGTGLLVISRFPISFALYRRFTVTGKIYMLHEADYLGAKGCGLVRLATPAGPVDVVDGLRGPREDKCGRY